MLLRYLRTAALAATLLAGGAGLALAQTQTPPTTEAPAGDTAETGGGTDWGWLGLLGLIGLAGLWRKRETPGYHADTAERARTDRPERVHTDTTVGR